MDCSCSLHLLRKVLNAHKYCYLIIIPMTHLSIYSRKSVCLFVCFFLYKFRHRKSHHHQTFHDTSLGPGEGSKGVAAENKIAGEGWRGPLHFCMLIMH